MIRVFPRRTKWTPTDELCFIGDPPLFKPPMSHDVFVSCTFTWDIPEAQRLYEAWRTYYHHVELGGPAYGDPGGEFIPGTFIKPGITITSRGCPKHCPWCFVSDREGKIRELDIKSGWIIQDNNLLACSPRHIIKVFEMLKKENRGIKFSGGLDTEYLDLWHIELLKSIKIDECWFACDWSGSIARLERIAKLMEWLPESKKRCYVLIGYDEERIQEARLRLAEVYSLGFLPFPQLYQEPRKIKYTQEWKDLARKWSRPAAYRSTEERRSNEPTAPS